MWGSFGGLIMGRLAINLIGMKFGSRTVIERSTTVNTKNALWVCRCDCGAIDTIEGAKLRKGESKTCLECKFIGHSKRMTIHGMTNTKLYKIWHGIKSRCADLEQPRYGGRGIKICSDWDSSFESFMTWCLANGYKQDLQIDRIDNDGDYCPQNCKFISRLENCCNKSNTIRLPDGGSAWLLAKSNGLKRHTFQKRIVLGWTPLKAATFPIKGNNA